MLNSTRVGRVGSLHHGCLTFALCNTDGRFPNKYLPAADLARVYWLVSRMDSAPAELSRQLEEHIAEQGRDAIGRLGEEGASVRAFCVHPFVYCAHVQRLTKLILTLDCRSALWERFSVLVHL